MSRFEAALDMLGGQEVLVLSDHQQQRRVRLARQGSALIGFEVKTSGGHTIDLADDYRDAEETRKRPGSRFAILAPFAGRIGDARYTFEGKTHDLQPRVVTDRGYRHGFVRDSEFELVHKDVHEQQASVTLGTTIRPQPGYPWTIALGVSFALDDRGLTLEVQMKNIGDVIAPCFFGWHPYFKLGDEGIDEWELQIPAQTLVCTDRQMIVRPGEAAFAPVADTPALDFRQPRRIGDSVFDQGYTHLQADTDGRIRTRLRNPEAGLGIAVWQERGVMHAFTADTVSRPRQSIALEPMECMANAFDRPDCADAIRLLPNQERRFRCGVEVQVS